MTIDEYTCAVETWKPIPGFHASFQASNCGRVRRVIGTNIRMVSMHIAGGGYVRLNLRTDTGHWVTRYAHCLVMAAFAGPKPNGMEVNHKDGNKENNRRSNLEYCTPHENILHAHRTGLVKTKPTGERHYNCRFSDMDVQLIRLAALMGQPQRSIARDFGTTQGVIGNIVRGITRKSA